MGRGGCTWANACDPHKSSAVMARICKAIRLVIFGPSLIKSFVSYKYLLRLLAFVRNLCDDIYPCIYLQVYFMIPIPLYLFLMYHLSGHIGYSYVTLTAYEVHK